MEEIKRELQGNFTLARFMNFDKMITPVIIKVIFIIGVVVTTLLGLGMIVSGLGSPYGGGISVFMGLLTLVVGPIFNRVYCELIIVVFKVHEALEDLRRRE